MDEQEKPKQTVSRRRKSTSRVDGSPRGESLTDENAQKIEKNNLSENKIKKMKKIQSLCTKNNLLILLLVILAIGFLYYFMQYKKLTKDPAAAAKEKTAQAIKAISALAVVPTDPNAVLANVSDITKLKGQSFFDNAQNGDEIVIFPSAMRAVLYRPSINKIINIGPLSSSPDAAGTQTSNNTTLSTPSSSGTSSTTKTPTKNMTKTPVKTQ